MIDSDCILDILQPRSQGFSLEGGRGASLTFKGKALGTRLAILLFLCVIYCFIMAIKEVSRLCFVITKTKHGSSINLIWLKISAVVNSCVRGFGSVFSLLSNKSYSESRNAERGRVQKMRSMQNKENQLLIFLPKCQAKTNGRL